MARLSFRCGDELVQQVDEARGDVARELWLRKLVQREIDRRDSNLRAIDRVLDEAPAERPGRPLPHYDEADALPAVRSQSYRQHVPGPNVEGVRSSSQAKRDVRPVPKKG